MRNFAVIVLAAGLSSRMGEPKMLLPWGNTTVLGRSVQNFLLADPEKIIVVTGGNHQQMEKILHPISEKVKISLVFNPDYRNGEMLNSVKVGILALPATISAAFIALGDQPQLDPSIPPAMVASYALTQPSILLPSHDHRRGHPWLVSSILFPSILALKSGETMRKFLQDHTDEIEYFDANDSILKDLDTPEDYRRDKP